MIALTKQQRKALYNLWYRLGYNVAVPYRKFRRTVQPGPGCVMVPFGNMWLGIEPDGYTHS